MLKGNFHFSTTMKSSTNLYFSSYDDLVTIQIICFTCLLIIACNSQPALYIPTDSIALDCGSSGNTTSGDGRVWVGDMMIGSQVLYSTSTTSIISSAQRPPLSGDAVPYFSTARVFRSDFTYVFPVTTSGQKFIRLHFYPSTYQSFDRSKAAFSVIANGFTLLNNFNASLTADSLGLETIEKEYSINVEEEDQSGGLQVNLTFSPSDHDDAYAFINGIEIVSMPTNLYYTSSDNPGFTLIGHQNYPFRLENTTALQMVYRLNVGGQSISPMQDTGMFRTWSADDDYCSNVGALPFNNSFEPIFAKILNYTAPAQLYHTARSMGNDATTNERYNLTWNLPVDPNFTYMIRLHFCEFQIEITNPTDRQFTIFIANQTAEPSADVIVWSEGSRVPVFKDYAVQMIVNQLGTDNQKQLNLSVALHPKSRSRTRYNDAILNGLEVFKLNNSAGNLAGLNPDPVVMAPPPSTPQPNTKSKRTTTFVIAIVVGVLSGVIALSILAFLTFRHRRKAQDGGSSHGCGSWWRSFSYVAAKPTNTGGSNSHLPSDLCRHFSLAEIKTATNNFDSIFIIGRGGFGDVYKGYIDGGATPVAIKRLKPDSRQGAHEFKTEIEMLSYLRHLHLVSLIGYCNEVREMILVYDYMSRGTLRDHLFDTENPPLSWKQRLVICIGAARGLHYLHAGAKQRIIHRDVKTSNILLDDKWVAKVSDFGLSKINPTDMSNTHISTVVKGSLGYLDPEYYRRQQLTEKSDVYSFGVVLFEVLCARPPLNNLLEKDKVNLARWARLCYENGTLDQIIDPHLMGKIVPGCLKKFGEIAVNCVHDEGIKRPSMNDVVWSLEFALQLQEGAEEEIDFQVQEFKDKDVHGQEKKVEDRSGQVSSSGVTMTNNSGTSFTSYGSEAMSSGAVFSEIGIPKGR